MAEERFYSFPAALERVPEACEFVVEAARAAGLDERAIYHCQLATDEWCTNIIEHGDAPRHTARNIEIRCHVQAPRFVVTISDSNQRFDPMALPEADTSQPLGDRPLGGLGWSFIRKVMDEVRYRYGEGRNHLVMVKMGAQGTPPNGTTLSAVPTHTLPGGVVVVAPVGRLDSLSSRTLESALLGLVGEGRARLVVDLRAVTYISSTGLKVLLTGLRQAQRSGGGLMLANLGPRVREVFEISGFDTVFSLLTSVEDAAARL